jgi:hypothetical protein
LRQAVSKGEGRHDPLQSFNFLRSGSPTLKLRGCALCPVAPRFPADIAPPAYFVEPLSIRVENLVGMPVVIEFHDDLSKHEKACAKKLVSILKTIMILNIHQHELRGANYFVHIPRPHLFAAADASLNIFHPVCGNRQNKRRAGKMITIEGGC